MSKQTHSAAPYVTGFVLSLVCTIIPYWMVVNETLNRTVILTGLAVFAVLQVLIQVIFFLHLGQEKKPRLQLRSFIFMATVVVIVVFGSLWIMNSLDYHMMPGNETTQYIQDEEAITPYEH